MIRLIAISFALAVATSAPGNVARAASSAGRHDHASSQQLWRGNALERSTRSLRDDIRPPPCPSRSGHRQLNNKEARPGAVLSGFSSSSLLTNPAFKEF